MIVQLTGVVGWKHPLPAGGEIRATVVRGGTPGETALIRSGESLIRARIEGRSILDGEKLLLKIERGLNGEVQLRVVPFVKERGIRPEMASRHLSRFFQFVRSVHPRGGDPIGVTGARVAHDSGTQNRSIGSAALRSLQSDLPPSLRTSFDFLIELVESGVAYDWTIELELNRNGSSENQPPVEEWNGDQKQRDRSEREYESDTALGAFRNDDHFPYFLTRFRMERLGEIHLMVASEQKNFERISLLFAVQSEATREVLDSLLPQLQRGLEKNGVSLLHGEVFLRTDGENHNLNWMA